MRSKAKPIFEEYISDDTTFTDSRTNFEAKIEAIGLHVSGPLGDYVHAIAIDLAQTILWIAKVAGIGSENLACQGAVF
jgi:hypothetical protein